ncbi:MAG: hypothetical protein K8I65_05020 [Thermoanaerobaculia bacterium]|nr:hypothetical protein [Thermoanaerobaculia bacterium]
MEVAADGVEVDARAEAVGEQDEDPIALRVDPERAAGEARVTEGGG